MHVNARRAEHAAEKEKVGNQTGFMRFRGFSRFRGFWFVGFARGEPPRTRTY